MAPPTTGISRIRTAEHAKHLSERKAELLHGGAVYASRHVEVVHRNEVNDAQNDSDDQREHGEHCELP